MPALMETDVARFNVGQITANGQTLEADMVKTIQVLAPREEGMTKAAHLAQSDDIAQVFRANTRNPKEVTGPVAEMVKAAGGGGFGGLLEALTGAFAQIGTALNKEIAFGNNLPSSLGLAIYDLAGPAQQLYPVFSPFRNMLARVKGVGQGHLVNQITGLSGSGTGGVLPVNPAISATNTPTAGGNLEGARGNAIAFSTNPIILPFKAFALYQSVTLAQFLAGQGYQDMDALVSIMLLQAGFNLEEVMLLMGRSTVLGVPGTPTGTARATLSMETGIVGAGGGGTNVYCSVTAIGPFGDTAGGTQSAAVNIPAAQTKVIDFTWSSVAGALGYNVFAMCADAAGGYSAATCFFYGPSSYNSFTVGAKGRITTGRFVPATDSGTGNSLNYDGFIASTENNGGYTATINASLSGASLSAVQDLNQSLWDTVKGNPDELWTNGTTRRQASDLIIAGAAAYRVQYERVDQPGVTAGVVVNEVLNEVTGKPQKLTVHPWLPAGNLCAMSYTLPFQTQYGSAIAMEAVNLQDYMQIKWPMSTLRHEQTLFWMGLFANYAPTFMGVIHGIATNADNTKGPLH